MFYETKTYADDRLYYAMMFLNHLFGGSSSSKLFTIVREKYGLCYSINSMYLGASGILICSAIIEKRCGCNAEGDGGSINIDSKEEYDLEEVRKYYLSLHRGNEDYQETAINNYLSDHFFLDTPRSYLEEEAIQAVSKKDLQEAFSRLEQTFVYVYGGGTDHGKHINYQTKTGLRITYVQKPQFQRSYCGIGCKYGSAHLFYIRNQKEMVLPAGLAHF